MATERRIRVASPDKEFPQLQTEGSDVVRLGPTMHPDVAGDGQEPATAQVAADAVTVDHHTPDRCVVRGAVRQPTE
jgi:hypothetical protein